MSKLAAFGLVAADTTEAFDRELSRFEGHVKDCRDCSVSTAPRELCSPGRDLYRKLRRTLKL